MSIEQRDTIDIISQNRFTGEVTLTISDHLDWSDSIVHQSLPQAKLKEHDSIRNCGDRLKPPAREGIHSVGVKLQLPSERTAVCHRVAVRVSCTTIDCGHELAAGSSAICGIVNCPAWVHWVERMGQQGIPDALCRLSRAHRRSLCLLRCRRFCRR